MNKQPASYKQTDLRWKDLPYRTTGENATIGGSGCGPTCAAMLIETLTGETFTPADACRWSVEHGYKALNQGTYYSYFVPQFAAFGIKCGRINEVSLYHNPTRAEHMEMIDHLNAGDYIIACMGKGLWTSSGHFVVVWRIDNESVYILDPASDDPRRIRGDVETFLSQVKYYWWVDGSNYNREAPDRFDTMEQVEKFLPWAAPTLRRMIDAGHIAGSGKKDANGDPADMDLSRDMIRLLVMLYR